MARARKPDPIGVVTFSGALAALIYALIKGDDKGWTSPESWAAWSPPWSC